VLPIAANRPAYNDAYARYRATFAALELFWNRS
jgi:hypothetical protein